MSTRTLADVMAQLASGISFPARVRVFCDDRLAASLPVGCVREWAGLQASALAAAACGAAVAESERGGQVLIVTRDVDSGTFSEAATLAGRLGLDNLHVVLAADEPALLVRFGRESSDRPWGQASTASVSLRPDAPSPPPITTTARAFSPVHLAALGAGGMPPWPITPTATPVATATEALAWIAEREPRVLLAHSDPLWSGIPDSGAKLFALAQLCGEGRRVAWMLPTGTQVLQWIDALAAIGRQGLGLKLLCHAGDLSTLSVLSALDGWWVTEPADAGETGAVLAQTLDTDDSMLVALPSVPVPPQPVAPWMPGSGRWLAAGADLTLVCRASSTPLAWKARELLAVLGIAAGVYQCTSLVPLPCFDLRAAAARAPMLVVEDADAAHGLGRAVADEVRDAAARCDVVGRAPGSALSAADVAQAARTLLTAG